MAIDFAFPKKQQNYDTGVLASIRANQLAQAKMFEGETFANDGGAIGAGQAGIKRINDTSRLFERWSGTAWAEYVLGYVKNTAPVSYGSITLAGSVGGYAGVQFSDGAKKFTLMVDTTSGLSGMYSVTDAAWKWYFDGAGALTTGTVPWGRITGAPSVTGYSVSEGAIGSTVALRSSSGYLYATYFNQTSGANENPAISQVMVTNSSDGFLRKASLTHLGNSIVVPWGNISSKPGLLGNVVNSWNNDSEGSNRIYFAASGGNVYLQGSQVYFRTTAGAELARVDSSGNVVCQGVLSAKGAAVGGQVGIGAMTFSTTAGARAGMTVGDIHVVY